MSYARRLHVPMLTAHWAATILLVAVGISGCALLTGTGSSGPSSGEKDSQSLPLPPIKKPRTAIQLEIVFIDRPADDPLLGPRLWEDVDQVSALPVEVRTRLRKAGIRVGQVGSTLPAALESLLKMSDQTQDGRGGFTVRRVALPSGSETEIETSPMTPVRRIEIPEPGEVRVREFRDARCVLRVRLEHVQEGWARLEIIPEVHHGSVRPRPTATASGWLYRTTQSIEHLFGLRFSMNLNLNETVVITADSDAPLSAGYQFFRGASEGAYGQRLVMIRLAGMPSVEPLYVE
ncbi:MAG TPA: hypothetical protein EYP14_13365 [Planctomycetaceae bacterium]|nr:hypothetical protein [Planctomycetaceae bacterium]